ncbi:hypothetical protein [Lutibacter citreus]|uniref:hypothetical protein n=1 Tax=Lutibacter citreus TaxID=2138210 RepID=UPI000DBE1CDC|nr:hypothetical protein [Lutibacter citreus]
MKNYIWIALIIGLFISCDSNEELENDTIIYGLVKMSGRTIDSETTGAEMEWQENICFYSDGTFKKLRIIDDEIIEASGTYINIVIDNEEFYELTYNSDNTLIASCLGGLKEQLKVINSFSLKGTWSYCDGPSLEYNQMITCSTLN